MKTAQLSNMYLTRGDTFVQALTFQADDLPIDLTAFTSIEVDIRKGITRQGGLIKKLTLVDGLTITSVDNNILTMTVPNIITDTMTGGKYYLDVQVVDVMHNQFTYCWGVIIVRENITD